ncbi:MAG: 4Fe-4S dicluster domain-containing protein [Candidatus Omnitrophica bacterium]|nr:4Fe-4S dicluster domain-containing protein [Candidatus Omnitrophota bacterium]
MTKYYITNLEIDNFFNQLRKDYKVFFPVARENRNNKMDYAYQEATTDSHFLFNPYRTIEPLKVFFTYPYESVGTYFDFKDQIKLEKQTVILGVKACDLYAHKIQDFVFLEGVQRDTLYKLRRDHTLIISGDCTDFKEVCHCLAWEIMPYPTEGFDLNLSPLNEGYIVEVGSERGQELIQRYTRYFSLAKETQVSFCKTKRQNFIEKLNNHLKPQNLVSKDNVQRLVRLGYDLETWQNFSLTCVECGGCNLICDTCHCFLLADRKTDSLNEKIRIWDSCQYANFARVAGGANPLKTRSKRLRNRFMKKFDFFIDNLGIPACCGCGRCIEVCPGRIDIREVLKDLANKVSLK